MDVFRERLEGAREDGDAPGAAAPGDRRWIYVPYDQLTDRVGPLSAADPGTLGIVLIESGAKGMRRPYHKQKLAFIIANLRQFAIEQARRGVAVRYVSTERSYAVALAPIVDELGPLQVMEPAERELRSELDPLLRTGALEVLPHEAWLTSRDLFEASADPEGRWRMDRFYRAVRRDLDILMEDGRPEGGKYSFDAENRQRWDGDPPAPAPPRFEPDDVVTEVGDLVSRAFGGHPGRLDLEGLPTTADDARAAWSWALEHALPHFGPYEDAMSSASTGLFHTRISPLLNVCRLLPSDVLADVLESGLPIQTREGFVRQVIGWREFVRHVHVATDGFRSPGVASVRGAPGDAGYAEWLEATRGAPDSRSGGAAPAPAPRAAPARDSRAATPPGGIDGGSAPAGLEPEPMPLPAAFWGTPSGLSCLDTVVESVWEEGWSHHITRLMILGNIATLLGVSPRDLTDWFWVAYVDAFDWVVEPNVLAMGTYAVGDLMTTKPYVSGANYIQRMSDYCASCAFDPKTDCPLTRLYWAFLERHRGALAGNPRLRLPLATARRRPDSEKARDARTFQETRRELAAGRILRPAAESDPDA